MNNKLKFWLVVFVFVLSCGVFSVYFCMAKPCEPNNIVIEKQENAVAINYPPTNEANPNEPKIGTTKIVGSETYLCEITSFYERVITILSIMIFTILGLTIYFSLKLSNMQIEEVVYKLVDSYKFNDKVDKAISDRFIALKNEGEIPDILEGLEDITARVKFLEEQINIQGYEEENDSLGEDP